MFAHLAALTVRALFARCSVALLCPRACHARSLLSVVSARPCSVALLLVPHAGRDERSLNLTYLAINERAPNLGCFRNAGLYRNANPSHVVIHRIKGGEGMRYVWRTLARRSLTARPSPSP